MGPGGDDDVIDIDETPIDNQVWLGLLAGALIGGVVYYRRQRKTA